MNSILIIRKRYDEKIGYSSQIVGMITIVVICIMEYMIVLHAMYVSIVDFLRNRNKYKYLFVKYANEVTSTIERNGFKSKLVFKNGVRQGNQVNASKIGISNRMKSNKVHLGFSPDTRIVNRGRIGELKRNRMNNYLKSHFDSISEV